MISLLGLVKSRAQVENLDLLRCGPIFCPVWQYHLNYHLKNITNKQQQKNQKSHPWNSLKD